MDNYLGFSKIYDELISEDISYEKIARFIRREVNGTNRYLDLGCGTGSLSSILGRDFRETFLVDLSPDMLTMAEDKFNVLKIPHRSFALSMNEISFQQKFDLITSSIDAVNYILDEEDMKELFKRVYTHLEDGGVFIFDVNSPYKIREILGSNDYVLTRDDLVYTWENYYEDDVVEMSLNFFIRKGKLYERIEEIHEERAYETETLIEMLEHAGFENIILCDDYTENPVHERTERITFIVRKR
ncbi:class I SAM-dependent methyltransferase [Proteiniclasticum sp.]|uniref:class I SAM-dependent DNA methyltransferase n=1 Tax=Proteiniclasticum sp. TaxID=2053595 RepID=UPI00289D5CBC|nr:class I SAM-dependent methyltransferase [Proteiniclasticum sp.]